MLQKYLNLCGNLNKILRFLIYNKYGTSVFS